MKKLFVMLFLLLALASCAKSELCEFDAKISITAGESEYDAVYEKRLAFDKIRLIYPESLSGVEFLLCDGVCTVTLGDTSFECEGLADVFDFLPVFGECEKSLGARKYKIYDVREVK